MNEIFEHMTWRFIDQSISANKRSPLESFAIDDTLCHVVGQNMSASTIRTWVHHDAVVLGIQDHRLPYIQEGMTYLEAQGFEPIVRNSGGLAVVLDAGVLNISLVLSEQDKKISINEGFEFMVEFIRRLLPEVADKIDVYEIVGSYCPGTFDLSIDGQKFAGISQRRMKNGIAVQIYLCVEGNGGARAAMIRDFYQVSLKNEETKFAYPNVNPAVMASLQELISPNLTVQTLNMRAQQLVANIQLNGLNEDENELYAYYLQRIFDRNAQMLAKK
jgi:octanoyl-[GcvH]:protein N-octanoyltransferase